MKQPLFLTRMERHLKEQGKANHSIPSCNYNTVRRVFGRPSGDRLQLPLKEVLWPRRAEPTH